MSSQVNLIKYRYPFNHVIARDCFSISTFSAICEYCHLQRAHNSTGMPGYSANIVQLGARDGLGLDPLLNLAWLGKICAALEVPALMEIDAALHTHPPGSPNGWLHNDFNPGWFDHPSTSIAPTFSRGGACVYTAPANAYPAPAVRRVRAVAVIVFLDNEFSNDAQGGHTLLADSARWPSSSDKLIPPIPNSTVAFEVSPTSWHAFQSTSIERKSVMLWMHHDIETKRQKWPRHDTIEWD